MASDRPLTTTITGESAPGASIPDLDPGGVADVVSLSGQGTVRSMTVRVDITHNGTLDAWRLEVVTGT